MTPRELIDHAVRIGIQVDPRGEEALREKLRERRREYESLSLEEKETFDGEALKNPFGDTRLALDPPGRSAATLLVGIEIGRDDILFGDRMGGNDESDLFVISHHASQIGPTMASIWDTVDVQIHTMTSLGVPEDVARTVTEELAKDKETSRKATDAKIMTEAEGLGLPLASIHAPADLMACLHIQDRVKEEGPRTLKDFLESMSSIEEFSEPRDGRGGPRIKLGRPLDPFDPVYYSLIGGWNPLPQGVKALGEAGVKTLIMVECAEDLARVARNAGMSVVILPHYPYDSLV